VRIGQGIRCQLGVQLFVAKKLILRLSWPIPGQTNCAKQLLTHFLFAYACSPKIVMSPLEPWFLLMPRAGAAQAPLGCLVEPQSYLQNVKGVGELVWRKISKEFVGAVYPPPQMLEDLVLLILKDSCFFDPSPHSSDPSARSLGPLKCGENRSEVRFRIGGQSLQYVSQELTTILIVAHAVLSFIR